MLSLLSFVVEGKVVVLESAMFPGHFLGFRADGSVMVPTEAMPSQRETWFTPHPHSPLVSVCYYRIFPPTPGAY